MDTRALAQGVAIYTVVAGAITVGAVYFLTHSGLYTVALTGIGVVLAVFGGASGGTVVAGGLGGTEEAGSSEMMSKDMKVGPTTGKFDNGVLMILYGFGLILWSVVVLTFFSSGLQ
ncbi:hypothetical protein [Haloarchaeobius sp. TZWWS8]|uniref:hypothetical protein n=1 Tax=Haloarchaeobius sp. TZWWS8 TaxID=3446121 RepID=UPI003EB6F637